MTAIDVADLSALEILDACGRPTRAPTRGERVARYNRLMGIAATAPTLGYGMP